MLSTLPTDVIQLIFDELSFIDRLAFRGVCRSLQMFYRRWCARLAKNQPESICDQSELADFIYGARLTFKVGNNLPLIDDALRCLYRYYSGFKCPQVEGDLKRTLSRALTLNMHPPPMHIRKIMYHGDNLYILDREGYLYRNQELICGDVEDFYALDDTVVIRASNGVYVRGAWTGIFPSIEDVILSEYYLITQRDGHIFLLDDERMPNSNYNAYLPIQGWSFPMGVISFAGRYSLRHIGKDRLNTFVVVTTFHQAFLIIVNYDKIISTITVAENILSVISIHDNFMLLSDNGTIMIMTTKPCIYNKITFDLFPFGEYRYQRITLLGDNSEWHDTPGQNKDYRCDVLCQGKDYSHQIRFTEGDTTPTIVSLNQRLGAIVELKRGTYELVY